MKLEDQVCCLKLAKRLKELGVKQESVFVWERDPADSRFRLINFAPDQGIPEFRFSAFTVAKLGEMLPRGFFLPEHASDIKYGIMNYWRREPSYTATNTIPEITADTETDARAKLLVYILELSS